VKGYFFVRSYFSSKSAILNILRINALRQLLPSFGGLRNMKSTPRHSLTANWYYDPEEAYYLTERLSISRGMPMHPNR